MYVGFADYSLPIFVTVIKVIDLRLLEITVIALSSYPSYRMS